MAMLESAESQIAGLWGLASPTKATPNSTPQAPRANAMKAKPAKFRKQEKGVGKGQPAGRKRQEPPEDEETGDQVLVSQTELRTIRTLLVRHDQALNHLAVDRTYVLFFSTTEMSTLTMLRTVTNHWREQYEQGTCATTLRAALLTSLWMEMEARLTKFEQDAAAIKVMMDKGLFLDAPHRWAYTAWNQQEKKALVTDQPHLTSDELKAAIKTLRAAAMTDGVIHKFAPMQKLGENITAQAVVFTWVLSTLPATPGFVTPHRAAPVCVCVPLLRSPQEGGQARSLETLRGRHPSTGLAVGTMMPFLAKGGGVGACTLTLTQVNERRNRRSTGVRSRAARVFRLPKPPCRGRCLGGLPPRPQLRRHTACATGQISAT